MLFRNAWGPLSAGQSKCAPLGNLSAPCSLSHIPVCDSVKPAGGPGAHGNIVVIVEVDDIAEVVVLVPAGAAAVAGPLVRPEAVVGCAQMQPLQQWVIAIARAVAVFATGNLKGQLSGSSPWLQIINLAYQLVTLFHRFVW